MSRVRHSEGQEDGALVMTRLGIQNLLKKVLLYLKLPAWCDVSKSDLGGYGCLVLGDRAAMTDAEVAPLPRRCSSYPVSPRSASLHAGLQRV